VRVLLVYPGPLFSTFDVARGYDQALKDAEDVEVYSFYHHDWLKFYGNVFGANTPGGISTKANLSALLMASERVIVAAAGFVPEVVLVVSGTMLHRRVYDLLAQLCLPVAVLLTESPYEDGTHINMIKAAHIDLAFTNERTSAERLAETTGIPAVYLPHAYDPRRHRPMDVSKEYESDVFFHGTLWPDRKQLFASLNGLPYHIISNGIELGQKGEALADDMMAQTIDNTEMVRFYNGTRIALNHHRGFCTVDESQEYYLDDGEAESLGPRAFEIAACGAFQLCDDTRAELHDVFGDSVATYADAEDLRDQVIYYLEHDTERQEMARAARERVRGCTFADRARDIVIPALESIAIRR